MAVARASVADIRPESLAVRSAWQPGHLRWLLTSWQCREPTTSRAGVALLHLSTATCRREARARWYPLLQGSRLAATAIDIDSLFSCLVLRAFRSLLRRSRRRPHGWLGEGIGSVVVAPTPVTLTMCVTVKANALNEERVHGTDRCRRSCRHRPLLWHSHSTWQRLEKLKTQETHRYGQIKKKKKSCGKLWGRPGRRPRTFEGDGQGPCMLSVQLFSARRCTFEHCTSCCCPSRDATMVALTEKKKKNAKRRLPLKLYEKDLLRVGANVGSEMFSQVRNLVADRVHSPVSLTTKQPPGSQLQAQPEKVASSSLATIGARSSFSGARLAHLCWWPPLFFPTQNG